MKQATKQSMLAQKKSSARFRRRESPPRKRLHLLQSLKSALLITITWSHVSLLPALGQDTLSPNQWRTGPAFFRHGKPGAGVAELGAATREWLNQTAVPLYKQFIDATAEHMPVFRGCCPATGVN